MKKQPADAKPQTTMDAHQPSAIGRLRSNESGVTFNIKVVPRAARSQIEGWHGDALKVWLQAPPVAGKANAALITLLAEALAIGTGQVLCGGAARHRTGGNYQWGAEPPQNGARAWAFR